jgi:hypothetical protein
LINQALIAPYLKELFGYERFVEGLKAFLPEKLFHHIMEMKDRVDTIEGFQTDIILHILNLIEQISIRELTSGGLEHLNPESNTFSYPITGIDRFCVLNTTLFSAGSAPAR